MSIYVAPLLPPESARYRKVLQHHLDNMVKLAEKWQDTRVGLRNYIDHEFNLAQQFVKDENITLEKLGKLVYIYVTDKHENAHYLYNGRAYKTAPVTVDPYVRESGGALTQLWTKGWVDDGPPDRYIPHPSRPLGMIVPEIPDPISPLLVEFMTFGYQLEDSIQFTIRSRVMPQMFSRRERRRLRKLYYIP